MISVLLIAIAGIAVVVGAFAGLSYPVQGAGYIVGTHALSDKNLPDSTALANGEGFTLYYSSTDTSTKSTCTGDCAKTWLPLVSDAPTKDPKLDNPPFRGIVAAVHDVHGSHVTYNGHFLYTYVGDKAPGDATGHGRGGRWFVASPSLARW